MNPMSVLFDCGPLRTGSLFRDPSSIIEAWHPEEVRGALERMECARASGKWLAGSASYELGYALLPKLTSKKFDEYSAPLLRFGVFEEVLTPDADEFNAQSSLSPLSPDWTFDEYQKAFTTVHEYISSGDIYQANLTFPMHASLQGCARSLYEKLKHRQPVYYGVFIDFGDVKILSRTPELFFSLSSSGRLRARPMKGTIKRSYIPEEDITLREQLAKSAKNRAENLMIADLLRNDLGRIAKIGSVQTPKLFEIETYSTVYQMVSEVVAQVAQGTRLTDIFTALFPCGSITGAPKIRAMQILSELEHSPRGPYCGTIGWIAPDGAMEFSVTIRTLVVEPSGLVRLDVGGGIVYDSDARDEYDEALLKSQFAQG